ncbi:hypothetical protein HN014_13750 [Aquimarina sp. TRL1]|uniref:hypothetical protein n=1 Tax=Aquimarina sp. (strain TRL1) TaxID=2736252 RepID=UPI00158AEC02|nr:hypothetical protein [Aquimarina sp. TRL1]QKX05924.1 hypothetical protein HN014_13750 [Aquimarina sp. TRL1]
MISITVLLMLSGFFFLYNTSKRAVLELPVKVETWFQGNDAIAKCIGITLLLASLIGLTANLGVGAGVFIAFLIFMMLGSLVILLAPLHVITYKRIAISFCVFLLLELILS